MSDSEDIRADGGDGLALERLEGAVHRLLDELATFSERVEEAETRAKELEARMKAMTGDGMDPVELQEIVTALRGQNADLKERITQGREGVDRLLSRIRFLEDRS